MNLYNVYYENADTDEPRRFLGQIRANTVADALHLASQYWEVPSYDLVVELVR